MRELQHVVWRASERARCDTIYAEDLGLDPERSAPAIPGAPLDEIERYAILRTLEMVGGRKQDAASILGISSRKIQYRLHDWADATPGRGGK